MTWLKFYGNGVLRSIRRFKFWGRRGSEGGRRAAGHADDAASLLEAANQASQQPPIRLRSMDAWKRQLNILLFPKSWSWCSDLSKADGVEGLGWPQVLHRRVATWTPLLPVSALKSSQSSCRDEFISPLLTFQLQWWAKKGSQVWWILFLLLLTTSASTCLKNPHNLGTIFSPSLVPVMLKMLFFLHLCIMFQMNALSYGTVFVFLSVVLKILMRPTYLFAMFRLCHKIRTSSMALVYRKVGWNVFDMFHLLWYSKYYNYRLGTDIKSWQN